MKKIIYTIGILMFLSGPLHPWVGHAAEESPQDQSCNVLKDPSCRITDRIEYALRGKGNKGLDWGDSFGATDPKEVGQNLYLIIYNKAQAKPLNEAIKATAAQYGMPPERMSLILGGDISPILERAPLMRVEDAVRIYNQMAAVYNEKKDSLEVAATISAKVEPNEMFADGDLGNSGFDLINDLNNIEIILFKRNDLVTFGGTYSPAGSSGGDSGAAKGKSEGGGTTEIPVDLSGPATGISGDSKEADPCEENPFTSTPTEDKSAVFTSGINPNQCFATQNLDNALNKFVESAKNNDKLQSTACPKPKEEASSGTSGSSGSGLDDINVTDFSGGKNVPKAEIQAAPPGDYSSPPLCDDIVCISLEFIEKKATAAFNKTDNCIHCHVQYINESLQKTISHSLIPGKASGNLGESGLCKNAAGTALGAIGMNVSMNIVPIVTPPKDDLLTLGNITDEWEKYAALNGAWNYSDRQAREAAAAKTGKPDYTPSMSALERQLIIEILNGADGQSQAELFGKAAEAYTAEKKQEAKEQLVVEISKGAYEQVSTMKALDDEMKQMNKYFDGFQKQFRTLLEKVPGLPSTEACNKLKGKQACT